MNGRRLTDAQISKALRAHLPDRAHPGLRERILDAAETTGQQRALPSFFWALSATDPVVRRLSLLIAAALLVALAFASGAAVGALRLLERDPIHELSLEPPAGLPATINSLWATSNEPALTIRRTPGDDTDYYWRAVAYDRFDFLGWNWTETETTPRAANDDILAGTLDEIPPDGRQTVTFTVEPESGFRTAYVVSPLAPVSIDRESHLIGLGADGFFEALQVDGRDAYSITASVPLIGKDGITGNKLAAAGTDYPEEIVTRYGEPTTPGTVGPEAQKVLDEVLGLSPKDDPYDVAATMQAYLRSNRFTYDSDVRNIDCGDRSAAECFAWSKQGYCQHYATLMAVLLREHHIPARFVQGFLPGSLDARTGIEQISTTSAHAWVEVYFPGYGWMPFDPTGRGLPEQMAPLPSGPPVASNGPSARPRTSAAPAAPGIERPFSSP
jgi:transglutaminase-like putative cysteine protease